MYMQFEEAGLIRRTEEEYDRRMKENGSATLQSKQNHNNTCNVISMPIMAQGKGEVNGRKQSGR